jgi:hypothetical protein
MPPSPLPTRTDILALTSYLPRLYAEDITLVEWVANPGQFPYPDYAPVVVEFFHLAGQPCWCDYHYGAATAGKRLQDVENIRTCGLAEIKTLLTFCARGEHFSSGHWAVMIEKGYIRHILERLTVLLEQKEISPLESNGNNSFDSIPPDGLRRDE